MDEIPQPEPDSELDQELHHIKQEHNKRIKIAVTLFAILFFIFLGMAGMFFSRYNYFFADVIIGGEEKNVTAQQVDEAKNSLPDLMISHFDYGEATAEARVFIKNIGNADYTEGSAFTVEWTYLDEAGKKIGGTNQQESDVFISAGAEMMFQLANVTPPSGTKTILVFVDSGQESSKLNNAYIYNIATKTAEKAATPEVKNTGTDGSNSGSNSDVSGTSGSSGESQQTPAQQAAAKMVEDAEKKNNTEIKKVIAQEEEPKIEEKKDEEKKVSSSSNSDSNSDTGTNTDGSEKKTTSSDDSSSTESSSNNTDSNNSSTYCHWTDTDGGAADNIAGKCESGLLRESHADYCLDEKTVVEYIVGESCGCEQKQIACAGSCSEGRCVRPAPTVSKCYWEDTDGGIADNIAGTCRSTIPDAPYQKAVSDFCKDDKTLVEFSINNSCGGCDSTEITCAGSCSSGRCVRPAPTVSKCYWEDSDGGVADNIAGTCGTNVPDAPYQKSLTEYCKDDKTLIEYSVNNSCGGCDSTEITCAGSCSEGRCVRPAPTVTPTPTRPAPTYNKCYWEDTDDGYNIAKKATCGTNVPDAPYQKSLTEYCKDDKTLIEYEVNNSCGGCTEHEVVCDGMCSDGACVRPAPIFNFFNLF
jgi:hypothetical protein